MFLHANMIHIFFNMWVFLDLGRFVEELYGWPRYLFFYVASGIVSFLASTWINPQVPSLGASGAIAGVLFATIAVRRETRGIRRRRPRP